MNNFLHFQLNFDPKNYFQNMRNSDDFHLSKTLHMLRKPVDKHKYVYCMCDYLILISSGWLRKFSMHYRGNIWKKKILILVVGYWFPYMWGKRLRWKVEGWGGGGGGGCAQNSEPTLPDILVGTFSRTTPFMFFHPSSLPKLWNNSVSMPSCRSTLRGAGKAVLVFWQVCPRV